jgi:chromosome segregation ATPase
MANPRELAEQAFALLQNALRDSEARAADLDAELKRKKAPKGKLEEQLDVLQHRLEAVEAESARWQQAASHLEEIAEAERVKVAALKKKLDIAESGPEKLTKKEINFWRAKAEDIDTETKDYKSRLANLRRELMERDALIEKLRDAQQNGAVVEAALQANTDGSDELDALRAQIEQRERRITELQVELNDARDTAPAPAAEPSPEMLAQIESLQRQVATFEHALTEAHTARATFKSELAQARAEAAEQQRSSREIQANAERTRGALTEREHKITELSAEAEHLRAELRQRDQQLRDDAQRETQRDTEIKALARDLDALRQRAENDRRDASHAQAEREQLREALRSAQQRLEQANGDVDSARKALVANEAEAAATINALQAAVAERDRRVAKREQELDERNRAINEHVARAEEHEAEIAERDAQITDRDLQLAERDRQIGDHEARLAERDRQIGDHEARLAELDRQIGERENQLAERDRQIGDHAARLAERDRQLGDHDIQLAERDRQLGERDREIESLDRELQERRQQDSAHRDRLGEREQRLAALSAELEAARTALQAGNRELSSLRDTLLASNRDLDLLRNHKHRLEQELSNVLTRADDAADAAARKQEQLQNLAQQLAELERQRDEMREQMAGLEAELKEEKENGENLMQLANERREAMIKIQEQAEESEERYEEAKWRLGKAQHFERLVQRRKGLVAKLLAALRAKAKSNIALKAGLDGLRTYKAAAEVNQQKLLQRIDALKMELKEAEETIDRHQGSTIAKQQLADTQAKALTLEARLNTQAELIQQLESDLKVARATQKSGDEKNQEIERLHKELEQKTQIVTQMQADVDDQQRKLAKLRGSESETMRLKAISEKDRSSIDELEREVAQLREALQRQGANGAAGSGSGAELEAKLKERETSVTRLMGTIKEHEQTIKKLTESADSWKRKYNFLATDSPDAYKTAAEK